MRQLDLVIEYLQKERLRHVQQTQRLACDSKDRDDYEGIVHEAKVAHYLGRLIEDIRVIESDPGEFITKFLNK